MPLAMSRPWKHPNSGVYWLRKGVPEDLRRLVGKREEKQSLQTRDPVEAKRRHAEALAEIEIRWANLRAGPKTLTEREAHQLAVAVHDRWLQQHLENPSQQTAWDVDLADRLFAPARKLKSYDILDPDFEASMDEDSRQISRMENWCFELADQCLAAQGLMADETGRRVLAGTVAAALQRASLTLASLARGGAPSANFFSVFGPAAQPPAGSRQPVEFKQLVDGWAAERRPAAKTRYEWSRVIRQLEAFLGHGDAQRLTGENLIDWKRSMVEAGLRAKIEPFLHHEIDVTEVDIAKVDRDLLGIGGPGSQLAHIIGHESIHICHPFGWYMDVKWMFESNFQGSREWEPRPIRGGRGYPSLRMDFTS